MRLGDIMEQYLKAENMQAPLDEQRALAMWPEVVGASINRYTTYRNISSGVMEVQISSAALRNELMMTRSVIIKSINDRLGKEVVKDIIFR